MIEVDSARLVSVFGIATVRRFDLSDKLLASGASGQVPAKMDRPGVPLVAQFPGATQLSGADTSTKTLGDLPGSRIGLVDRERVALRILTHGEPCDTGYTNLAD